MLPKYRAVLVLFGSILFGAVLWADAPTAPISRVELERSDLPNSNYEVISILTTLPPGAIAPHHTHFGIEVSYVLEGEGTLSVAGRPDRHVKAGDSFLVAAGIVHWGANTGKKPYVALATLVVEKGKPLMTIDASQNRLKAPN